MAKSGRPKKGSAPLPAWFDIEKYREVDDFRAIDWHLQLCLHFAVFEKLRIANRDPEICDIWLDMVKSAPRITLNAYNDTLNNHSPHDPDTRPLFTPTSPGHFLHAHFASLNNPLYGVQVITNKHMTFTAGRLLTEFRERTLGRELVTDEDFDADNWGSAPFVGTGYSASPVKRHFELDLSLPDELLVKQFVERLKEQRKSAAVEPIPFAKTQHFYMWYECGVLPFIDLKLWELASGQSYRWSAFEDALSTIVSWDENEYKETCRKTVNTLAERLLTEGALHILNHQVLADKQDGCRKSGKLLIR